MHACSICCSSYRSGNLSGIWSGLQQLCNSCIAFWMLITVGANSYIWLTAFFFTPTDSDSFMQYYHIVGPIHCTVHLTHIYSYSYYTTHCNASVPLSQLVERIDLHSLSLQPLPNHGQSTLPRLGYVQVLYILCIALHVCHHVRILLPFTGPCTPVVLYFILTTLCMLSER